MSDYADAHDRFHAAGFEPEEGLIRVHHEITSHLDKCDCDWADYAVEMGRDTVELDKAVQAGLPMDVVAALRQAQLDGMTVADIVTMLTVEGWELRVMPSGSRAGDLFPAVTKIIRQEGGRFCVYSEDGSRSFGCYDTEELAQERLRQIHSFSNATPDSIREGVFVRWNSSGGVAQGRVEHVMTEGTLGVPGSSFSIEADPDDPAVLIRIYRQDRDGEWQETETLVGHRASTLTVIDSLVKMDTVKQTFEPPKAVQEAAQRAVEWIEMGFAGDGFTAVGRTRAGQLSRGEAVSLDTIRRMRSYFARHVNDSQASGWNRGEQGFPSPGRVAWDAWGGDAGRDWANMVWERATKSAGMSLTARQKAMYQKYEWITEMLGPWDYGVGPDGSHYMSSQDNPFLDKGLACKNCVFFQGGGRCEIVSGPVEAEGLCKLWIIPQALVDDGEEAMPMPEYDDEYDDDDYGDYENAEPVLSLGKATGDVRKAEEYRFTLGPWYIPDMLDAHGEFTDATELQSALWRYVRSGDRRIRLQHNVNVVAGEAVEMMTWPYPVTLPLSMPDGSVTEREFPPNTVFLGVVWEPWAWEYVKAGRISGYSIGGRTDRVLVDLPE